MSGPRVVRAPRGTELSCKGWPQEGALRMLHNNLDPEVAERPDDLVVYGGAGPAARGRGRFGARLAGLPPPGPGAPPRGQRGEPGRVGGAPRAAPPGGRAHTPSRP